MTSRWNDAIDECADQPPGDVEQPQTGCAGLRDVECDGGAAYERIRDCRMEMERERRDRV
jgi:hypothetical protein